jgi:hypothetical protein
MKFLTHLAGLTASALAVDIIFREKMLTISHANRMSSEIQVKLNEAPQTNVSVYLEAPTLQFSNCALNFTPQNSAQWQTVKLTPVPYFPSPLVSAARPSETITALVLVPDSAPGRAPATNAALVLKTAQAVMVNYNIQSGKTCTSWGDPHLVTLDGHVYDFYGQGDYFLVKSPLLDILTRQEPYPPNRKVTVNTRLFIRFQDTFLEFTHKNNQLQLITHASSGDDGVKISTFSNGQVYVITFLDGSSIRITVNANMYYDILSNLSGYFLNTGVSGLCGNYNGDRNDDKFNPETFRAKTNENYFINGVNTIRPDYSHQPVASKGFGSCKFPPSIINPPLVLPGSAAPTPTGFVSVPFTFVFDERKMILGGSAGVAPQLLVTVAETSTIPNATVALVRSHEITMSEAEKVCINVLQPPECFELVDLTPYLNACVSDIMATGDFNDVEASREEFLGVCYVRAKSMLTMGDEYAKEMAAKVRNELKCQNNCNDRGSCIDGSCVCNPGFTGTACSIDIKTLANMLESAKRSSIFWN